MARTQASSARYKRRSPSNLLDKAQELQQCFEPQKGPEGEDLKLTDSLQVALTEENREFLYQLLGFLAEEGKAGLAHIEKIQRSLKALRHTTQAHKDVLAWTVHQWWMETDKAERGRLITRLHDGVKAPTPKEKRKGDAPAAAISVAGQTASRPGNLAELGE